MGFQETGDFVNSGLLSYYFNDCGFVGIIGQIGIWAFIIVGIMLFRFGFIVVRMLKKNSSDGSLLLGLYVFFWLQFNIFDLLLEFNMFTLSYPLGNL